MKRLIISILIIVSFGTASAQWVQLGNLKKLIVSDSSIMQYSITKDNKFLYVTSKDYHLRKFENETGELIYDKDIKIDSLYHYPDKWLSLSIDGSTYSTFRSKYYPNSLMYGTIILEVFDIDSFELIDTVTFNFDCCPDENTHYDYFSPFVNYSNDLAIIAYNISGGKHIGSRININYNYGLLNCFKNKDNERKTLLNITNGYNKIKFNESLDLLFVDSYNGSSEYYNLVDPSSKSHSDEFNAIYDLSIDTIYYISKKNESHDSYYGDFSSGYYLPIQESFFTNDSKNFIYTTYQKLIKFNLDSLNSIDSISLNYLPNEITCSRNNKILFVISNKNVEIHFLDKLSKITSFIIDSVDSVKEVKAGLDGNSLYFTDSRNCVYKFYPDILSNNLKAFFSINDTISFVGNSIEFYNNSTGEPDTFFWDLGDGTTSKEQNPIHTYSDTGYYDIKLIITKSNQSDTLLKKNSIYILPILNSDFDYSLYPDNFQVKVQFNNKSVGKIDSVLWDFGDGTNSKVLNPEHIYLYSGEYQIKLIIFCNKFSQVESKIILIAINEPKLDSNFLYELTYVSKNLDCFAIKGYQESNNDIIYLIQNDNSFFIGRFNINQGPLWEDNYKNKTFIEKKFDGNYLLVNSLDSSNSLVNYNYHLITFNNVGNILNSNTITTYKIVDSYINDDNNLLVGTLYGCELYIQEFLADDSANIFTNFIESVFPPVSINPVCVVYKFDVMKNTNLDWAFSYYWKFRYMGYDITEAYIKINGIKAFHCDNCYSDMFRLSDNNLILLLKNGVVISYDDSIKVKWRKDFTNFKIHSGMKYNNNKLIIFGEIDRFPFYITLDSMGTVLDSVVVPRIGGFNYASITPDSNVLFSGYKYIGFNERRPYFIKVKFALNTIDTSEIDTSSKYYPYNVNIMPNPVLNNTIIEIKVDTLSYNKIEFFDFMGRKVKTVLDGALEKGYYKYYVEMQSLGIGMYYFAITHDNRFVYYKVLKSE